MVQFKIYIFVHHSTFNIHFVVLDIIVTLFVGMPRQTSYGTGFGAALNIETLVAAAEQRDTPLEVNFVFPRHLSCFSIYAPIEGLGCQLPFIPLH